VDNAGKLAFTRTKDEDENRKATSFKVTLGVMPDYVYNGEGMRVDGVLEDRPAMKAGLLAGDVIIKIGDVKVTDIYSYMEGLGKFKAGDKAKVVFKRGTEVMEKEVQF
jgi:S1-C subfamily serine protease